jgi:hypothetical protein
MFRKILFAVTATLLLSFTAWAQTPCPIPKISNVQTRVFNSQVLGSGVEVTWTTQQLLPCSPIRNLSVTVFLETIKGEKLTLRQVVSRGAQKVHLVIPASKVHIFSASDARLKIRPVVAIVHDRR